MENMSKILIELRKEKSISQKELADQTGISQSTIAKIEIGRNEATSNTIRKLADFFNVTSDYLLGRTDELGAVITPFPSTDNYTDEEKKLIADYRELTPPLKRMIQETLKTWKSSEINTKKLS